MRLIKSIAVFLACIVLAAAGLAIFVVSTDYVPEPVEAADFTVTLADPLGEEVTLVTFNLGYCGLDRHQDFFMDGGTGSRSSSEERTLENLQGNIETLEEVNADILLLQEVDVDSTRSFHVNQRESIIEAFSEYSHVYSTNYRVPWVPVPLNLPMGSVESGLLTLVKSGIDSAYRYALPTDQSIPDRYFLLDRCIQEVVVPLESGEELHVINLHLSAYDSGGVIKDEQMQWLKGFLEERDLSNDHYILGGDWNQLLADEITIDRQEYNPEWLGEPPTEFFGMAVSWVYDYTVNTVRDLYEPYAPGHTFETVIDGFLVSENIEVVQVETVDLGFEHTDHHPVVLTVLIR